jgi:hypothetical protein
VIAPVLVLSVSPGAIVPTIEKVKGGVPPVTPIAGLLNSAPTIPVVPVTGQTGVMCPILYGQVVVDVVPPLSVTLSDQVPTAVGVPATTPVAAFSVKPAGKDPEASANV